MAEKILPQMRVFSSLHRQYIIAVLNEVINYYGVSKRLRKERELSFYGAEDFIPTEEYSEEDAELAIKEAEFVLKAVLAVMKNDCEGKSTK